MTGITDAGNVLAAQFGVTVNRTKPHDNLDAPPVAALISAATRTTFQTLTLDRHQRAINEMLDDAAGQAGLGEDRQHVAAALAGLTLTLYDERQAAVEQARDLIIAVTELGVLAPAA